MRSPATAGTRASTCAARRWSRRTALSLEDVLGRGSVSARIDAEVTTDVRETHFPGVWWVAHHNPCGVLVAEFIEICVVPEILSAPAEDIARGLAELRANTAAGGAWSGRPPT